MDGWSVARKPPSKGWAKVEPATKRRRRAMKAKCGSGCFLDPKALKYPICKPRRKKGAKVCTADCRALAAARSRACQYGKKDIATKALKKARAMGCDWAKPGRASNYVCPSKPRMGKWRK